MLPDTLVPLNEAERERLAHFLRSPACGHDALDLSYAHGFLTALASGPEPLEPGEWLRLVMDEPVFDSVAQAEEILSLWLRWYREIERALAADHGEFLPALEVRRDARGEAYVDPRAWCRGYLAAVELFREHWTAESSIVLRPALRAIAWLAAAPREASAGRRHTERCQALGEAARAVYRYWRAQRDRDAD